MYRERFFRAWDTQNKKWLFTDEEFIEMLRWIEIMVIGWDSYEIDQAIGIDKNGIRIYENDILKTKAGYYYSAQEAQEMMEQGKKPEYFNALYVAKIPDFYFLNSDKIEKIGNIYENQELLKT